jgi:hypothetical protein
MPGKASGTARYRIVVAEKRGAKVKKKLEIDPLHADTVRLIFHLALDGDGGSAPMGVKAIVNHLNARHIFTRDGGRWGIGQVHRILTRRTYIGEHEFNKRTKAKELKPQSEVVVVEVPPLIDRATLRYGSGPQSQGHARPRGERPDAAHRQLLLRQVRRCDDHPHRQGRALSLLHLFNQGSAGRDGLRGPLDPDG